MTFYAWLKTQAKRADPIGDLACDVLRDSSFPRQATLLEATHYLNGEMIFLTGRQAVIQAIKEYKATR